MYLFWIMYPTTYDQFHENNIYSDSFSSALQKRHVQIHDLRSRLNNTGFKIGELQNINSKKDELIKALEQQLGKEKREVDSMKIELDKVGREKSNVLISRIFLPNCYCYILIS